MSDRAESATYPLPAMVMGGGLVLDARETVSAVMRDLTAGVPVPTVAARFHNAIAVTTAATCACLAEERGLRSVVLSGGVFQNRLLLERTMPLLTANGLRVLVPTLLPPGDGGISYGQAAVAAARLAAGGRSVAVTDP